MYDSHTALYYRPFLAYDDGNIIRKLAAYVILGINCDGIKEVIRLEIGENESSKYWFGVLNAPKNRGVKDIMVLCADGLGGMQATKKWTMPLKNCEKVYEEFSIIV